MSEQDEILGFDDVTVSSNDSGYVLVSQYDFASQENSQIVVPHSVIECLVRAMRKHKRLAAQAVRKDLVR